VLLVGISKYDNLGELLSGVNDFTAMDESFENTTLSDAEFTRSFDEDQKTMIAKIETFQKRVEKLTRVEKQNVFAVIYFTCHGHNEVVYDKSKNPKGADTFAIFKNGDDMNISKLGRDIGANPYAHYLGIYDCCRNYLKAGQMYIEDETHT